MVVKFYQITDIRTNNCIGRWNLTKHWTKILEAINHAQDGDATYMKVTTLSGSINWDSDLSDSGDVGRAILRDNGEFAIDCTFEGVRYDVRLNRVRTDYYRGTFNATQGSKTWPGTVACRLWHSGDDLLARGDWLEGGSKYIWTAELQIEELN